MDDYGQHDGDRSYGGSPFARQTGEQPWLRQSVPPWHMWGNSQIIGPIDATASDEATVFTPGQLVKVSYKRPETWQWVFHAKIVNTSAAAPGVGATARITVHFDLILGVGRSQSILNDFDVFSWVWAGLIPPPIDHVMWAMSARTPPLNYRFTGAVWEPDPTTIRDIAQFEAEDVQLSTRVDFFQSGFEERPNATVEVSAYLAPRSHVRPDWFHPTGPIEQQFPGDEIGGR